MNPQRKPIDAQALATVIDSEMAACNLPGVVCGIWMPGESPVVICRGLADLETGRARTPDDPFRIGSITKTFIGTAVLQLVDGGKLAREDPLSRWYPDFPNAGRITVRDLLRMRSGIADSYGQDFVEEIYADPLLSLNAEQMIARSAAKSAQFIDPDIQGDYCNTNFMLLERIIEKVTETDIRSHLARHVLEPLGLRNTVYPIGSAFDSPLRGYGYESANGRLVDRTLLNTDPAGGAGAMVSTLADLQVQARELYHGTLLKPATQAVRLENAQGFSAIPHVGYGDAVGVMRGCYGHSGTIFGSCTSMWYLAEHDGVIVLHVNRGDVSDENLSKTLFEKIVAV